MKKPPNDLSTKDLVRYKAEQDLYTFIKVVHPHRVLGHVHQELIRWATRQDAKSHQLILLPRDHQKSSFIAYRVAWEITKDPTLRVLYISATSKLAKQQLKLIKDILTSDNYRFYWPEMVNPDINAREKWTETEIAVDHPARKAAYVRDPTIFIGGLTTTVVGLHSDINVLDDVVIDDNAYSPEARETVSSQVSYLSSVLGTEGRTWVVGTRYHPLDQYQVFLEQVVEIFGEHGELVESYPLFEVFERVVETNGVFLWPRTLGTNGRYYGFNKEILARKKASYTDFSKFRAQYYNDPNDVTTSPISRDTFKYYNKDILKRTDKNTWEYQGRQLRTFASIDFAFSNSASADYTSLVVVGMDYENNIYVLDIRRFKTNRISEYFDVILSTHQKWGYNKIRAEVSVAQEVIVEDLKHNYIVPMGLFLSIEAHRPSTSKEERIYSILEPRYANGQIWHFKGGECELLEEELVYLRPPHDDIKDSLASVCEIAEPPFGRMNFMTSRMSQGSNARISSHYSNPRFGGIG